MSHEETWISAGKQSFYSNYMKKLSGGHAVISKGPTERKLPCGCFHCCHCVSVCCSRNTNSSVSLSVDFLNVDSVLQNVELDSKTGY